MLNSLGKDRAAALALEQAILPSTGDDAGRTRAFAWYNVIQDIGHGLGAGLAVSPTLLRDSAGFDHLHSLRVAVIVYAALYAATAILYLGLSKQAEAPCGGARGARRRPRAARSSTKMSLLFALDSFAGGFQGSALFAFFFHQQFGASEAHDRPALRRRAHHERGLAPRRRLARAAHRAGEHHGVHAHALERPHLHHPVHRQFRGRRDPVPPARGTLGDGRADAPVAT